MQCHFIDANNVAPCDGHKMAQLDKFAPIVASRLAAKLAEVLCQIKYSDPLDDYY